MNLSKVVWRFISFIKQILRRLIFTRQILLILVALLVITIIVLLQRHIQHAKNLNLLRHIQKSVVVIEYKPKNSSLDVWRSINNPEDRHQIYSAYFDDRPEILADFHNLQDKALPYGTIRVIAIFPTKFERQFYCSYLFEHDRPYKIVALEAVPIHENFGMEFSAFTIACPVIILPDQRHIELPKYVAVTFDGLEAVTSFDFIPVSYPMKISVPLKRELALCIAPLQHYYNEVRRLVEFIEMYKILGVKKFYFYNKNSSQEIQNVLNYYEKTENLIKLMEWNLNGYKFRQEIRYDGIFAALNDCLYRAAFIDNIEYIGIVDLDEIIIPFRHETLLELIKEEESDNIGAFIFRSAFLHRKYQNASTENIPEYIKNKFLYTQAKIERTRDPYPSHDRSKYIVKTRSAIELGNHFVWRFIENFHETVIHPKKGLIYHYRNDCTETSCPLTTIIDIRVQKYGPKIWHQVDAVCQKIYQDGVCSMNG